MSSILLYLQCASPSLSCVTKLAECRAAWRACTFISLGGSFSWVIARRPTPCADLHERPVDVQVPYEVQEVNILKGAHKDPEFAKLQVAGTRESRPAAHALQPADPWPC
jgi:hypothetical protein